MAFYAEEEDVWKCAKHPSKRRRPGICPYCLAERLSALCPDCAAVRPCSCFSTSTSSSASSSFSINFSDASFGTGVGSVGRISSLIESEPSFRRSRSAAVFSIFRSARFSGEERTEVQPEIPPSKSGRSSFSVLSSVFRRQKSRREEMTTVEDIEELKMRRSRSVAASIMAENEMMRSSPAPAKGKGWYFPSPMKVFRHSKASKLVHERSPLHRG